VKSFQGFLQEKTEKKRPGEPTEIRKHGPGIRDLSEGRKKGLGKIRKGKRMRNRKTRLLGGKKCVNC